MADKQITVAVPEERVPEFYVWFGRFLSGGGEGPPPGPGFGPRGGRGPGRGRFGREHPEPEPWSDQDAELAAWFYAKLAPPAKQLVDTLLTEPGKRWSGNDLAAALGLEKGAHGVAGILAWPGRYCRKVGRELPIATAAREDNGTDYWFEPELAELFTRARTA